MAKWRPCQDCGQRASGARCRDCAQKTGQYALRFKRSCKDCGSEYEGVASQKRCKDCRPEAKKRSARMRYRSNPEHRERQLVRTRTYHRENRTVANPAQRQVHRDRHLTRKLAAIQRYGGSCACCGETRYQFLTLDHQNRDGAEHRRRLLGDARKGGGPFLIALARQGWPDVPGLRVLCSNCHMAIDLWGGCPHALAVRRFRRLSEIR
jgi:hypothetical protein